MTTASRILGALTIAALLGPSPAWSADPAQPAPARPAGPEAWGATRWGMTADEVLAALGGEAFRLKPELKLPDGNVVAAGIDGHPFEGLTLNVRFVFQDARLALVSLRTLQGQYAEAAAYEATRKALVERWGPPVEDTTDSNFIDMRQTRWNRGATRVDLKYIPGVVAIVFYPAASQAEANPLATPGSPRDPVVGSSTPTR